MAVFPTQRRTLALLTAGSASEVTNKSSFVLSWARTYKADGTPKNNNSGYSVGTLQSDVGQRPNLVGELVHSYYQWAGTDATRLVERGNRGNRGQIPIFTMSNENHPSPRQPRPGPTCAAW